MTPFSRIGLALFHDVCNYVDVCITDNVNVGFMMVLLGVSDWPSLSTGACHFRLGHFGLLRPLFVLGLRFWSHVYVLYWQGSVRERRKVVRLFFLDAYCLVAIVF